MLKKKKLIGILVSTAVLGIVILVLNLNNEKNVVNAPKVSSFHTNKAGVALNEFDPVSYFADIGPDKGKAQIHHEWQGAKWYFANAENRELFIANPDKYAPQFKGYCAFATSVGTNPPPGSPEVWSDINGKLFLNANVVAKLLFKVLPSRIESAEKYWSQLQDLK